jgi:hypothetical protein
MQDMARLWSKTEPLDMLPSMGPVVGVTRAEVPLPDLLRDSWTTGLANHDGALPAAETPERISERVDQRQGTADFSVEVEVDWLPRVTRRRRALIRGLAAVLVLSLGLELQELRSEGPLPSVQTVLMEAAAWLKPTSGILRLSEPKHIDEAPGSAVLVAATESAPGASDRVTPSRSISNRSGNQSSRPRDATEGGPARKPARTVSAATQAVRIPVPQPLGRGVPRIVVGSDDVWGVKSFRSRNIGDALAYNSEDDRVLERIFGDN